MKRGTPDHPKVRTLARRLGINHGWAVGILELLWHFAAQYAPRGDIGRYSDEEIAEGCSWPSERPAGELIGALVECRLLDQDEEYRLLVHDWAEHADSAVHYRLAKARVRFATGEVPSLDGLYSSERRKALEAFGLTDDSQTSDKKADTTKSIGNSDVQGKNGTPWRHHGDAMAIPWRCHGDTMAIPWRCHGNATECQSHYQSQSQSQSQSRSRQLLKPYSLWKTWPGLAERRSRP